MLPLLRSGICVFGHLLGMVTEQSEMGKEGQFTVRETRNWEEGLALGFHMLVSFSVE